MEHICYVLYSKKYHKIYVGYTSSLIERKNHIMTKKQRVYENISTLDCFACRSFRGILAKVQVKNLENFSHTK